MTKLLKMPLVVTQTGLSRSHLYALVKQGFFPKPVKLTERSSAWVESEVQGWIDTRIALRDQEAV
jgi:prophage regulatory protein